MILSLPEIELEVMSVSSSSAASAGAWPSTIAAGWRVVAAIARSTAASASIRATRLTGSRNRNTYAKYGSIMISPNAVAHIIENTAARGTNSLCNDRLIATPTTQVTT